MSVLRIHPRDNVAVALSPVAAGERAGYRDLAIWKDGVTL